MDGKKFLRKIRDIDTVINAYEDELDCLMARLTSTTSKPKDVNVMSTKEDHTPEDIEKMIELKNQIRDTINQYAEMKMKAKLILDKLSDYRHQTVLIKYYFQHKTLEQIAVEMDKSYQWICELRERGLEEFDKIFKKS